MKKSTYNIVVGDTRPSTIQIGVIERGSGHSILTEKGERLARRGDSGFPNGTKIWGARVINGKIPEDEKGNLVQIAVTDPRYKGEVKPLKWGAEGGSLIDVRYIKAYPTLDVLYQERILNFKIDETNESSSEVFMIILPNGLNEIDENIEPLFVNHLKAHTYNRDSKSKDPAFGDFKFYEQTDEQVENVESQMFDEKFEAGSIIRDAANGSDGLAKCKNLFSIIKTVTDETPEDKKLFGYLKMLADKKPVQVLKAVADYKLKVSNVFEKLKSYDAVDLTTEGTIVALKPKRAIIMSNVPVKPDSVYDYLLENYVAPDVFDATFKLTQITDKLK